MEENESTTPTELDNEPYICSLRVGGKFNFYLEICMKRKYCLHIRLINFCASLTFKIYFLKLFLSICLKVACSNIFPSKNFSDFFLI